MRSFLAFAVVLAAAALAAACRGAEPGALEVRWESPKAEAQIADANGSSGSPLTTVVYIENETGAVVRDAVLRLEEREAEKSLGFSIGTVTGASTHFEGQSRLWRLGDLPPGQRIDFPIGLWFAEQYAGMGPDSLQLTVELSSPDLESPVRSNILRFSLAR